MKRINKIALVLLASTVLFPGIVSGQQEQPVIAGISFSPVPLWPPDGNIPETFKNQYVFYDSSDNTYVLTWPDTLRDPQGSGVRTPPLRVTRSNNVKPAISVQINETDGTYHYIYQVQNESSAKDAIRLIDVAVAPESKTEFTRTATWYGLKEAPSTHARQVAVATERVESFMTLSASPEGVIEPGKTAPDLHVLSDFKPGFTTAFFQGGSALSLPSGVPEEVTNQLQPLMAFEQNSQVALTLGPLHGKDKSKVVIATNFYMGLGRLAGTGYVLAQPLPKGAKVIDPYIKLDPDSSFVKEALAKLKEYITTASTEASPAVFPEIQAKPTTKLEKEIATALALAMKDE